MKSSLKFTFLLKNQRESFHQSRYRLHKHNLRPNLKEFIIQATKKFDDTIIITLFLNLGNQATCARRSTGTDKNRAIPKRVLSKGFEGMCNIEKLWNHLVNNSEFPPINRQCEIYPHERTFEEDRSIYQTQTPST